MNIDKEYGKDLCKSHSARSEKEFCRVCPSNLNKKELENVYFTLVENNLELKTTINSQREKIKILSTKVQRLTAVQKTYLGKEPKECCGSKALVNEQKNCISELRRSNEALSETVRQLNMRLCSAKQFLKRSPFQSTSRCNRCSNKNSSMSALITKRSEANLRSAAASSQYLVKDMLSARTPDNTVIFHEKGVQYDYCDENKCRSHVEELMKKNEELQEELLNLNERHVAVMSQLEDEVVSLRADCVRARSERALSDELVERLRAQLADGAAMLGRAELRCDELAVELSVERRRGAELAARLRAADLSGRIADVVETHLAAAQMAKDRNATRDFEAAYAKPAMDYSSTLVPAQSPTFRPRAAARTKVPHVQVDDAFRSSDDSGYTEANRSQDADDAKSQVSTSVNQMLLEKIADLQNQINNLKAFKKSYNTPIESFNATEDVRMDSTETNSASVEKQQIEENIISESSESVVTEKKANTHIASTKQNRSTDNEDIESEIKPVNLVSEVAAEYSQDVNRIDDEKLDDQQSETKVESKSRERSEISKRSSYKSHSNKKLRDRRQLSLQSLRKEKDLIKTGSLDETKIIDINIANTDRNNLQAGNVKLKGLNKNQTSTRDDDVDDKKLQVPDKSVGNNSTDNKSNKKSDNKEIVENRATNDINTGDERRKDSDSSKGTYSIHKDEKGVKLKMKSKEADINKADNTKDFRTHRTLADDVRRVLDSAVSADKVVRRQSAASEPRTYVKAPREDRDVRAGSPDSTECEISSLSDLPSERDERGASSRSPGEERSRSSWGATPTPPTTDYGSLSEGELPHRRDATLLSDGEKRMSGRMEKSHSVPQSPAMEATLAAVRRELARCGRLLRARPPAQPGPLT